MTYHTANLQSCILYIYSTNICTEYFKHGIYSPFFPSSRCSLFHNSNVFGSCIILILYTGCTKIKKNNSGAKGLKRSINGICRILLVAYIVVLMTYGLTNIKRLKMIFPSELGSCETDCNQPKGVKPKGRQHN